MGTDISGWVEITGWGEDAKWRGILQIRPLLDRNYGVFSSLFGIRDRVGFRPIAPWRGLPADISNEARKDYEEDIAGSKESYYGESWITWSEIKNINWEEEPEGKKYLLIHYQRTQQGELMGTGEFYESPADVARQLHLDVDTYEKEYGWREGEHWEKDGQTYEVQKLTRKRILSKGWEILFDVMKQVALNSANKDSRLVVWFDA